MKKVLFWGTTLLILVYVNFLIVEKERTLANGRTMLLRLAPIDPRSLIQGDYMDLRYRLAGIVPKDHLKDRGYIVVSLDKNNVARFIRLHHGEPLGADEHLLLYRNRGGLRLGAESFFFQEGDARLYERARYGELKVDRTGASVILGLRGDNFESLGKRSLGKRSLLKEGTKADDKIKNIERPTTQTPKKTPKPSIVLRSKPTPPPAPGLQTPKVILRRSAPEERNVSSSAGIIHEYRKPSSRQDSCPGKSLDMHKGQLPEPAK